MDAPPFFLIATCRDDSVRLDHKQPQQSANATTAGSGGGFISLFVTATDEFPFRCWWLSADHNLPSQ